jgi:sterol O-acyltransferase
VIKCFAETLGGLLFCSILFELYVAPVFENFGRESITTADLLHIIFDCVITINCVVFIGFYCLLHAWMNGFAEMMRFADRMFYKDWWTARSLTDFLSAWNVIVADWIYLYVYQDLRKSFLKNYKLAAMMIVFFCSVWVLEIILATTLRFIYPVFSCCSLCLMLFSKTQRGNFWFWVTFCCVSAIVSCLYIMEFYARLNCPVKQGAMWDLVVPVSWSCNGLRSK